MKKLFIFSILLLFYSLSYGRDLEAYVLYNSQGKRVDMDRVMKATEGKKFIFFGELHNNPISHWLQFELTKRLYHVNKKRLVLGAEMFEADNQFILDEFLNGKINQHNFQDEVRLWPNYNTDYKPLIEFAKEMGLAFVATNIPRRYALLAYEKGKDSLNTLSDLAKSYMVPLEKFEFDSTVMCYAQMIHGFDHHGGINMAIAQALKDATMAHFILENVNNRSIFVHYNGAYHSDNKQGIIHYLQKEIELEKILTLTTVLQNQTDNLQDKYKGTADFIVCVPETMTTTH